MSPSPQRVNERSADESVAGAAAARPADSPRRVLGGAGSRGQTQVANDPGKSSGDAAATVPTDLDDRHDADGWLFRQELVDCGKGGSGRCRKCVNGPGHGPYWYRYRWSDGKMHKRYVGKRLPESAGPRDRGTDEPAGIPT